MSLLSEAASCEVYYMKPAKLDLNHDLVYPAQTRFAR
jgi:hypothetical protein